MLKVYQSYYKQLFDIINFKKLFIMIDISEISDITRIPFPN
jgi:hypothetical protein